MLCAPSITVFAALSSPALAQGGVVLDGFTPHQVESGDRFGTAVALDGDTAAIAAAYDNEAATRAGAVYLYQFVNGRWRETQKILSPDPSAYSHFGVGIAVSGEWLAISEYTTSRVFLYRHHNHEEWLHHTTLGGTNRPGFGFALDLENDRLLVGAFAVSPGGRAYVFEFNGARWRERAELAADDSEQYDRFGWSVDLDGDAAIIGAPHDDEAEEDAGAAYVFCFDGDSWMQESKLRSDDPVAFDNFGGRVAITGDWAFASSIIDREYGDFRRDSTRVFRRDDGEWTCTQTLWPSNSEDETRFGYWCAADKGVLLVGAYSEDAGPLTSAGAAYLFRPRGNIWFLQEVLHAPQPEEFDSFGSQLAVDGSHALIGAWVWRNTHGRVYVVDLRVHAAIEEVEVERGRLVSGSRGSLKRTDEQPLDVRSEEYEEGAARMRTRIAFNFQGEAHDQVLDVIIDSSISDPAGTATVKVWDPGLGQFERVDAYAVGETSSVHIIEGLDAGRFVDSDGRVVVRIVHRLFVPIFDTRFRSLIDRAEARLRPADVR